MSESLMLSTEQEGVILRQLSTETDDVAYWQSVEANREHLSQFGDTTSQKYQSLEDVASARQNAGNKLRMGIWAMEVFVGTINATPEGDEVEIGYWIDSRYTGHGYATLAARSLARHLAPQYSRVYAEVTNGNDASMAVLTKAGFQQTGIRDEQIIFELKD